MTFIRPKHDEIVVYPLSTGNPLERFKRLIGKKIRDRRLELGFETQDDFAQKIDVGLNQETVSKWERGINIPQEKYHKKLFEVLKTGPELLDIDAKDFERAELLSAILVALPALDNSQLSDIGDQITRFLSSKSSARGHKVR